MPKSVQTHLKQACQWTGARWAALVRQDGGGWHPISTCNLTKSKVRELGEYLQTAPVTARLAKASRTRKFSQLTPTKARGLGAPNVAIFPTGGESAILVGGRVPTPSDREIWGMVARSMAAPDETSQDGVPSATRARRLALVNEVVRPLIGLVDRQQVAEVAADLLAQSFGYDQTVVILAEAEGAKPMAGRGGSGRPSAKPQPVGEGLSLQQGIPGRVFNKGESVLVRHAGRKARGQALPVGDGAGSEACVALKHGGAVQGVIDVRSRRADAVTADDVAALETLAGALSAILVGIDRYGQLAKTVDDLRRRQKDEEARLATHGDAESRLVQAAKLVAVGEMAAGIAHELNNPLTTVTGFAELILDEIPPDASFRPDVEMVLREALRARGVVRRLLDFARQGEPVRARADINEVLEDVLALTTNFIHTSAVQLELSLDKDLPWIVVDGNQMKQVFMNLIHNALHAMPMGGHLRIRTEVRSKDARAWIVAAIADTGTGIEPNDMERIFEPFFTTRAARGGTGLGLSVTYGIVTDHGGTIEVESLPGSGSTFSVWLPI